MSIPSIIFVVIVVGIVVRVMSTRRRWRFRRGGSFADSWTTPGIYSGGDTGGHEHHGGSGGCGSDGGSGGCGGGSDGGSGGCGGGSS